jgi:hypothetical protein
LNLALPALVILLAILPGVVLERAYYAGRFARRVAGLTAGSEVALYVLLAIPIDLIAIEVSKRAGYVVDWATVLHFMFGSLPASDPSFDLLAGSVARDIKVTAIAYACTIAGSYLTGTTLRRLVWASYLDTRLPVLRMKNEWFYTLLGRRAGRRVDYTIADVLTTLPSDADGGSRLFRGVVSHFEPSNSGGLQLLMLSPAYRGKLRDEHFHWVDIPGDEMVLLGSNIHSINVAYLEFEPNRDESAFRAFSRRFFTEEP